MYTYLVQRFNPSYIPDVSPIMNQYLIDRLENISHVEMFYNWKIVFYRGKESDVSYGFQWIHSFRIEN